MKLQPTPPSALNTITGYGEGYVMVNGERHSGSLLVTPEQVLPWTAASFDALEEAHFEGLLELKAEIVRLQKQLGDTGQFADAIPRDGVDAPVDVPKLGMKSVAEAVAAMKP